MSQRARPAPRLDRLVLKLLPGETKASKASKGRLRLRREADQARRHVLCLRLTSCAVPEQRRLERSHAPRSAPGWR